MIQVLTHRLEYVNTGSLTKLNRPGTSRDFPVSELSRRLSLLASVVGLHRWLKIADREDGVDSASPRGDGDQSAELREAHERIKLPEQEAEVMRPAVGYLSRSVNPK